MATGYISALCRLAHLLIHSHTHTHTLTHSHTHTLTHLHTHTLTYSHTHTLTHSLTLRSGVASQPSFVFSSLLSFSLDAADGPLRLIFSFSTPLHCHNLLRSTALFFTHFTVALSLTHTLARSLTHSLTHSQRRQVAVEPAASMYFCQANFPFLIFKRIYCS
jgi:hypothetical protein